MNLPKTLPSPAGPWGSPCDLDSRTISRAGGRDEVAMPYPYEIADHIRAELADAVLLAPLGSVCGGVPVTEGNKLWAREVLAPFIGPFPQEPATDPYYPDGVPIDPSNDPEAVAHAAETIESRRYAWAYNEIADDHEMIAHPEGEWVTWSEHEWVSQQRDELADALEALRQAVQALSLGSGARGYLRPFLDATSEALAKAGRP
jgi:hypothetical protein